jgi:hypothetical protein
VHYWKNTTLKRLKKEKKNNRQVDFYTLPARIAFIKAYLAIIFTLALFGFALEYRADFVMTLLLIWLIVYGAGRLSVDVDIMKSGEIKAAGNIPKSQKM